MTDSPLRTALELALAPEGLQATEVEEMPGVLLVVDEDGNAGPWPLTAAIDGPSILVHAHAPVTLPADQFGPVSELLHRINFGLVEGAFELDLDDGTLRVRAGADEVADGDEDRRVARLLELVADLTAVYGPALADVVEDGVAPAVAVATAEGIDDDDHDDHDHDHDHDAHGHGGHDHDRG